LTCGGNIQISGVSHARILNATDIQMFNTTDVVFGGWDPVGFSTSDAIRFTSSLSGIGVNADGSYRVSALFSVPSSDVSDPVASIRISVNGSPAPNIPTGYSGGSSSGLSGSIPFGVLQLSAGDVVSFMHSQASGTGGSSILSPAGQASIELISLGA